MSDIKPTAVKATTSVQPHKSSNAISWIAPLACIILGYIIWRFVIGSGDNFKMGKENGGFWPERDGALNNLARMYQGGIIVPILIGCF